MRLALEITIYEIIIRDYDIKQIRFLGPPLKLHGIFQFLDISQFFNN